MSVPGASNTELLEREAERTRMRLAESIDRLTSPSASEAVKQQVRAYGQRLKDEVLQHAQEAKDGVLDKARETGRETASSLVDDMKRRASENPVGVALIGAGLAWHLYKNPPVTTLLVGAGAAMLMMKSGRAENGDTRAYRDPYREDQPRGYVPGGVAGYGYAEDRLGLVSTMVQNVTGAAAQAGEDARHAVADLAGQAREVASGIAGRASEAVGQAGELVRSAADQVSTQALGATAQLAGTARDVGARAREAAQGVVGQFSGASTPSSYDFAETDEFEEFGDEERSSNRMGIAPWAVAAAGLLAGAAAYGYLRSAERIDRDDIWEGGE